MSTVTDVPRSVVRALRSGLGPSRVLAEPDEIDLGRHVWNGAVSTRPALITRCGSTQDVQTVVRVARGADLPISVRSGGHDLTGRAVVEGGVVIDVSDMASIVIDIRACAARIGAGVRSTALAEAADPAGLVPVTGAVGSVGMLGLTLGGGYGPLAGRFGLACDNLVAARLVTADGDVVDVDADHEPDLLWALRGGGGNFGVVTSALVRLHPLGPVYTGLVTYPWTQAADVLTRLADVLAEAPDALSVQTVVGTGRDGDRFVGLVPVWSGDEQRGPEEVVPVQQLGNPISTSMDHLPWHRVLGAAATRCPPGRHVRLRTRNVAGLTPAVVDDLVTAGEGTTSTLSALSIRPFHGAATRGTDTAFVERHPHQMIQIIGMWERGDQVGSTDAAWVDRTHGALGPHALPGGYVSLLTPDDDEQIQCAYGGHATRLLEIKARVDPHGVFTATPLPRLVQVAQSGRDQSRTSR